ncbi:cytochrome P450 [Aspergillus recurvatus]
MGTNLSLVVAVLLPVIVIGRWFYLLVIHPLSPYPGPFIARITNWYAALYWWRGDLHTKLSELHKKHGEIIRIGPNTISFCSQAAMTEIYSVRANVRKDDVWAILDSARHIPSTVSSIDKEEHRFRRRILTQIFSETTLKGFEDEILEKVETFCALLGPGAPTAESADVNKCTVKDLGKLTDYLAFDVISSLCFGKSFDMMKSSDLHYIIHIADQINRRNALCFAQPKIWRLRLEKFLLAPLLGPIRNFGSWFYKHSKERVKLGNHAQRKDFFHYLFNAEDLKTGRRMNGKELWVELLQLILAGSDTTAITISSTIFYLLHNPRTLTKLAHEIRARFLNASKIRSGPALESCVYLQACIKEALRLSPPITGISPRRILRGGMTVSGHYFPEGVRIGTPIYALHRCEEYFGDADAFRPERWIPSADQNRDHDEQRKLAESAFFPFSLGPRSCVAQKMAWKEITLAVAHVLFRYDLVLCGEDGSEAAGSTRCRCAEDGSQLRAHCQFQLKGWITSGRRTKGPFVRARQRV